MLVWPHFGAGCHADLPRSHAIEATLTSPHTIAVAPDRDDDVGDGPPRSDAGTAGR